MLKDSAAYFDTGLPCKNGHMAKRYVASGGCVECNREKGRIGIMTAKQHEAKKQRERVRYWLDPQAAREKTNEAGKRFAAANPDKIRAKGRTDHLIRKNRTPAWADLKAIGQFYANCPEGHEVDHYYPLQGETVCGLHVLENLQYLTILANRQKGNRFPE